MPELPEVEIIRQSLNKKIKQKKVKKVIVRNRNLRFKIPLGFEDFLKNQKILKVERFSKYLILYLFNNKYCLIHLGMSGTIHLISRNKKKSITNTSFYNSLRLPKKHNHVEIIFENFRFIYNDPRRFGFFQIIKDAKLLKKRFANLGPEPFQSKFNLNYVHSFFKKKEKNIKNFLLDQSFISGIGNIYASEILFLSKIKPNKKAFLLSKNDCKKIIVNSKKVLLNAIKKGGSSIRNFKNTSGETGSFQKNFQVYQREGLNCKRFKCSGVILKKNISNRSTFFCSLCQK
ncbi:bifunctional DNA-formamidopyrimidine glycosylase/DNA-(apurinic or apyrimidinic site) lyase [Candidatus Pelagibacter sp.]|nr:bifunctional DNA-formamidopyrimidine glycosylase/DNA-(apurinic or apyrimidinic site) lyase [Candidatus Pelagibacter sp.]|tara:strand:- start:39 stop:902 length:864 start_codon:yes stop_codon:yes gene_type:complete